VRAAGERSGAAWTLVSAAAAGLAFCALFFSGGFAEAPLVWIGGIALLLAALVAAAALSGVLPAPRIDAAAGAFLACLFATAAWAGFSTLWSVSPDRTWSYTNRLLVYAAFALLGVLLAALLPRPGVWVARGAVVLLALVVGWALLAKCVPALYPDYGRLARLRSPVGYWNELALLCVVALPLGLWVAAPPGRRAPARAAGVVFLYAVVTTLLLTYSRVGVVLGCLAAAGWVLLEPDRIESLAASGLGAAAGVAAFAVALALPGITDDRRPRSVRAHDGWLFALVLLGLGAAVYLAALMLPRVRLDPGRRRRLERIAGLAAVFVALAALAVSVAFAGRIWSEFTNPVTQQIQSNPERLGSFNSSNRWTWWQEAWHAFTRHPGGGTGAGTFELTDRRLRRSPLTTEEPHNVPLQFLSELGIVGFLLYLGAPVAVGVAIVRRRAHAIGEERAAVTALAVGVAAFFVHTIVDFDWNFVATCGPVLLVAGALVGRPATRAARARRPLFAFATAAFALAAVYSLAAPWLAQRELASAATIGRVKRAHAYDPLSTDVLTEWAALEDARGDVLKAEDLYRQAVALEPLSSETWYSLGTFYFDHRSWRAAYRSLSNAWTYDRFGPAGTPCGLLDQARHKVLGVWPPSCPGGARPSRRGGSRA
jgi:hypothetical protein